MHRRMKRLLSLVLVLGMVTVNAAPVLADELLEAEQPTEEQLIAETVEIVEVEAEPEAEQQNATEAEPVEQNEAEAELMNGQPTTEQLIAEEPEAVETEIAPAEQNAAEVEAVAETDSVDFLYNNLPEEQKKFKVYSGMQSLSEIKDDADILSNLIYLEEELTPDSGDLNSTQTELIKNALLDSREGDFKFYYWNGWNVWKVNNEGIPTEIIKSSGFLADVANAENFKKSAYMVNNGNATEPAVSCKKPIVEQLWKCKEYDIPVYNAKGGNAYKTITVTAANYNNSLSFPNNIEADYWKLIYDGTECRLNTASEIWTNETNGIFKIGRDFDTSKAKLQAVSVRQEGSAEFTQPDWYEGQPMSTPVVSSETNGTENITYYYKEQGADDSTYTTVVPDKAGSYTAKAVFAATEGYKEVVKTADFNILTTPTEPTEPSEPSTEPTTPTEPSEPTTEPSEPTTEPTEPSEPSTEPTTPTEPSEPTTEPTEPSEPSTEPTTEPTEPSEPSTEPTNPTEPSVLQEGAAEFVQSGWYVGEAIPAPLVASATNGVDHITYYYKEAGADDSAYTTAVPDKAGIYMAKAVFAATEFYQEVIRISYFEIAYLTADGKYSISGPQGINGWYRGDVTVRAESGYQIRLSDTDSWSESISVTKSGDVTLYLKSDGGAQAQAVTLNFKVDKTAPVISGVSNGEAYYGDKTAVEVTDEHLRTVTVNGKAVDVSNNRADITLSPSEEEDAYKIVAEDMAGNKTEYTVEVWETWVRDGISINGKKKLRRARPYKLGSGQWTVSGDSTVYQGNRAFYVKNGGEYDFKKK